MSDKVMFETQDLPRQMLQRANEEIERLREQLAACQKERDDLYRMGLNQSQTINRLEELFKRDELRSAAQAVVDEWLEFHDAKTLTVDRLRKALEK